MRAVDIQAINAQTPGVERAHQNRPQQPEVEQRQFQNIAQQTQDAKMEHAQEAPASREAQVQLAKEQERRRGRARARPDSTDGEQEHDQSNLRPRGRNLTTGRSIDIVI